MSVYLLPGILGLLVGLLLHWTGFSRSEGLQHALGLHRSLTLRCGLTAVGWSIAITALLCWLAVIDVDTIEVLPLSAGTLLGGLVLGIAAGLCGFTPSTAFAGLGADKALEALCVLAGSGLMTLLLPALDDLLSPLRTLAPYSATTLFEVTLDEPFLLGGGFLGLGSTGLVAVAIAMCVLPPRTASVQEVPAVPAEEAPAAITEDAVPDPEDAPEETFVAILPGEEPLVVDTADSPAENEESAEAAEESAENEPEEESDEDTAE